MPQIKKILVPIDVAQPSAADPALDLAREIADKHGARLILLGVLEAVPSYIAAQLPKTFHETATNEATAALNAVAERHGVAKSAEIVVRDGHPSTKILEYAEQAGADMIVIASHDPGVADYFIGSVTSRIVRHAHCSVVVVRPKRR